MHSTIQNLTTNYLEINVIVQKNDRLITELCREAVGHLLFC